MKLTRRCSLLVAAFAALVASVGLPRAEHGVAHADDDAGDACPPERLARLLEDVARARAAVTTLTGPFTQERTIGLLAAKVRSTGTLTLVRPDRLRWELAAPDSIVYWVTPEGLAYRSATGQGRVPAASQKIAAALDDLRVLLGGDLSTLRTRYDLRGICRHEGPVTFRAVPKAGAPVSFQEMRFTLAPDLVSPATATIIEGPRDRTEIRFGVLRANAPVAPASMVPGAG